MTIPYISIIMPMYNAEDYLEETLNSVLSQTLREIEVICVDDGSTDSSPEILRTYKEKDERVRVLTQNNLGAGPARNAGIKSARGRFIAFLDSDDYYPEESCLEKLYNLADTQNVKIAGGSLLFREGETLKKAVTKEADYTFDSTKIIQYKDFQQAYYYQRFIYSREMLCEGGIAFPAYRRFQDVPFFVKAMTYAGEFLATKMPTYVYRKSNNYACLNDIQINDMLKGYIDVLTMAKANGFSELFNFLAKKICGKTVINNMVQTSIKSGNLTAKESYSRITGMCKGHITEDNDSSFISHLKLFLKKLAR